MITTNIPAFRLLGYVQDFNSIKSSLFSFPFNWKSKEWINDNNQYSSF